MLLSIRDVKAKVTVTLLSLMVFAGCAVPLGEDFTIPVNRGNGHYIIDYNLQHYVPVTGEGAAVQAVLNRRDLDISVVRRNKAAGAVDQADITLTAKNGYAFDPEVKFRYPAGVVTAQSNDDTHAEDPGRTQKRMVTVIYKAAAAPQSISSIDLTSYIPVPVNGDPPILSFFTRNYGGTVVWRDTGGELHGAFQDHMDYTAEVTLTPAAGYAFASGLTFTHNAANSEISSSSFNVDTGNVTIVFRASSSQTAQTPSGSPTTVVP
jgi:hypothetical protein